MVFKKGHRINLGRKRYDTTLRNIIDNPMNKLLVHPFKDKHHSEETKIKMKQNHWSKQPGYVHPFLGHHHSENTKKIISQKQTGKTWEERMGKKRADELKKERRDWLLPYKGEKHSRWLGGKSFEPYSLEFNNQFKNKIRKRDNQICMNCNIHREKLNRALDVHHINYNKELSIEPNCISLCNKCHPLTNLNREYWKKLFQYKLSKLYGYEYSESEEIIFNINTKEVQKMKN